VPVAWVEHEVDRAPQQSAFDRSWTSDEKFSEFRLSVGADVVQFEQVAKLLRGWQVHVVTQRLIHEDAARRIQTLHYGIEGPAVILAATALTAVVTFLDLGGRAERHQRAAAAECKRSCGGSRLSLHMP
jgi:hypothetical protein